MHIPIAQLVSVNAVVTNSSFLLWMNVAIGLLYGYHIYGTIGNMPSVTTLPPSLFQGHLNARCLVSGDDAVYPPAFVRLCAVSSSASLYQHGKGCGQPIAYTRQEQLSGSISPDKPLSSELKEEKEEVGKRTQKLPTSS